MSALHALVALLQSINPFVLLLAAIATEICGATALRVSAGFTKLWPSLPVVVSYVLSFYLYSLVLKQLPMGVVYWLGDSSRAPGG